MLFIVSREQGRQEILQVQISAVTSSVYDDFALRHLHCMLVGLAPKFEFEESEFRVHTLRAEEWIKAFSQVYRFEMHQCALQTTKLQQSNFPIE